MLPRSNYALQRALYAIAHPLSILAMLLLLFNDHWLRWHYPSWLSGKLGDFAWLIFAPLIVAVVFAILLPQRLKQRERWVGLSALSFIALWFTLVKTVPLAHALNAIVVEAVNGYPNSVRMDTTDLLMLPALLVAWWIWTHAHQTPRLLRSMAYTLLALGIMLTLATSVAPTPVDMGIRCIVEQDQQIFVASPGSPIALNSPMIQGHDRIYVSDDGGEKWLPYLSSVKDLDCPPPVTYTTEETSFFMTDPANPSVQYHFRPGVSIERSTDGGQSWTVEMDLSELDSDIYRIFQSQKSSGGVIVVDLGPFAALFDSMTGNLIVTMGQDGILVRHSSGQWEWVTVGAYSHLTTAYPIDETLQLLSGDLILAAVLGFLSLTWWLPTAKLGCTALFLLAIGWVCWIVALVFHVPMPSQPTTALFDFTPFFAVFPTIVSGIIGLIFIAEIVAEIAAGYLVPKKLRLRFILTLLNVAVFLLPYSLWSQGTIPYHSTAVSYSLLLTFGIFVGGTQYLQLLPLLKNKKSNESEENVVTETE